MGARQGRHTLGARRTDGCTAWMRAAPRSLSARWAKRCTPRVTAAPIWVFSLTTGPGGMRFSDGECSVPGTTLASTCVPARPGLGVGVRRAEHATVVAPAHRIGQKPAPLTTYSVDVEGGGRCSSTCECRGVPPSPQASRRDRRSRQLHAPLTKSLGRVDNSL